MKMEMEITEENATKELLVAQAHVWKYTFNYITSMSLKCAVQLGIPDIIFKHGKPIILSELVNALSIPQLKSPHVYRLMRILVHSGFFSIGTIDKQSGVEEGYMLTPSSKLLLQSSGTNLSAFVLMHTDSVFVTPFHSLSAFLQGTVSTAFEAAHGTSLGFWGYCGQHPEFNQTFNDAMACDSKFVMDLVVKHCRTMFEGSKSLVDVGGGTGSAANALSKAFPELKCTVFDLPHVVSGIEKTENIEFIAGDMFEYIPPADIILLKWIMHDWSDEDCVKILKRCREAIPTKEDGGKVIIIDMVIGSNKGNAESTESQLCFDILMMIGVPGEERTETKWQKLFHEAGFTSYKITHALGLRSIIELNP